MRKFFLTLDLEEWYHLDYIKEYKDKINSDQEFVPKVMRFLKKMASEDIFLTVFILKNVADKHPEIIKSISDLGHEIACHGYNHDLVYDLSVEEFKNETLAAKEKLTELTGQDVLGYRAPCFSMEDEKLDVLWDLGFNYDASLIRFADHQLYSTLDMSEFNKLESLIYKKDNKFEFETPTLDIMGKSIPISGGGYFRLFPLWLMKKFIKKHWQKEDNFVFYIHPFEVASGKLDNGIKMGLKNYFRFQIGRRNSEEKLYKYIDWLKKQNVKFMTFIEFIKQVGI